MALYLGSTGKRNLVLDNTKYRLNIFSTKTILNGIKLMSSDLYVLKDSNGTYLTVKERE